MAEWNSLESQRLYDFVECRWNVWGSSFWRVRFGFEIGSGFGIGVGLDSLIRSRICSSSLMFSFLSCWWLGRGGGSGVFDGDAEADADADEFPTLKFDLPHHKSEVFLPGKYPRRIYRCDPCRPIRKIS